MHYRLPLSHNGTYFRATLVFTRYVTFRSLFYFLLLSSQLDYDERPVIRRKGATRQHGRLSCAGFQKFTHYYMSSLLRCKLDNERRPVSRASSWKVVGYYNLTQSVTDRTSVYILSSSCGRYFCMYSTTDCVAI
jgi:hypothetical protein